MKVTVLGSGTSHGVPMIGCECAVCTSDDVRNQRMRPSVLVSHNDLNILVDASPDLRAQAINNRVHFIHAVLVTHSHADHILGLDDLRIYNYRIKGKLPLYSDSGTLDRLHVVFDYAFSDAETQQSKPKIDPLVIDAPVEICGLTVTPFQLFHGRLPILGFHFQDPAGNRFAYATDCKVIPDESKEVIRGADLLIVDALRYREHPTHFNIDEATAAAEELKPGKTLFTHIAHDVDHGPATSELPDGIDIAYDGQVIDLS